MSTLVIAAILIGLIVAVCWLLVTLDNKQKRKTANRVLQQFHAEGVQNNLSFSSQEILAAGVIGLDGVQRKLLFLKGKAETGFSVVVIHLANVKSCLVKKHFGLLRAEGKKGKNAEQYLQEIVLRFEFAEEKPPVDVCFFDHIIHSISQAAELETKARHWEMVLSKLIAHPQKQRA